VMDSGTGIAPEIIERIWEPFFTTKEEGKGTGLGLATVRGIAAGHHGSVRLETALGRGTTFRVFLPAADVDIDSQAPLPIGHSSHPMMIRGQGELVLVVDDEHSIRTLIVTILGRFGYRVLAAANGTEAMQLYTPRIAEVALVVTDLSMPGIGGAKLAGSIKRLNPSVKLMFISGGKISEEADSAPEGMITLAKPFTGEDLLRSVHRALNAEV